MPPHLLRSAVVLTVAWAGAGAAPALAQTHQEHGSVAMADQRFEIPPALKAEHEEIHGRLVAATKLGGRTGEAARALAAVLHPHFVREEQIALPPLGLLVPLAGGAVVAHAERVLPMTDSLRAELPGMLAEHRAIAAATRRLGEAAAQDGQADVARLAEALLAHAALEEQVMYPAAILVGDVVRARASTPQGTRLP